MSRSARRISETGLYHVIFRGINKQNIFSGAADYEKLKDILRRVKKETEFELYSYCLMTNHVHLFLKEKNPGEIAKIMSKILSHYATWYNKKYERSGALFSNRYKSEPVEDDRYLIALMRYIHQNPLKAGLVKSVGAYPHSSYNEYIQETDDMVDTDFILSILHEDRSIALSEFKEINKTLEKEDFEITDSRKNDATIRRIIMSLSKGVAPSEIDAMDSTLKNAVIKALVNEKGISMRALERVTGISRYRIAGICNKTLPKMPRPQAAETSRENLPSYLM